MLTATKGTAMLNTVFAEYAPWSGPIATRENGSLTAHEQGQVTSYALESIQQRGKLFCGAGDQVYEDQVVGIHQRNNDLKVNVCKKKQMTNIRRWGRPLTLMLFESISTDVHIIDALQESYVGCLKQHHLVFTSHAIRWLVATLL